VLNGKTLVIVVDSETATAHMFWGQVSVVHDPDVHDTPRCMTQRLCI
jgi:hypothetical protein